MIASTTAFDHQLKGLLIPSGEIYHLPGPQCPPRLLHAVTEALGVIVVVRVHVARIVFVVRLVVYAKAKRVLVGVGAVTVEVKMPE